MFDTFAGTAIAFEIFMNVLFISLWRLLQYMKNIDVDVKVQARALEITDALGTNIDMTKVSVEIIETNITFSIPNWINLTLKLTLFLFNAIGREWAVICRHLFLLLCPPDYICLLKM